MAVTTEGAFLYSRRRAMAAVGAMATGLAAPSVRAAAAPGLIDVHQHIRPGGRASGRPVTQILDDMDRGGIGFAIGFPGYGAVESLTAQAGRVINDNAAQLTRDHPTRLGLFAILPMLDVDGSLAEIGHALDALGAYGFGVATSYREFWLGDARFQPIWAELDRRRAVVFVHPFDAPCCTPATLTYETPPVWGPWIEWPMNTARTILSLMTTGTARRHPNVRFIFAHGGGVAPLLIPRIAGFKDWATVAPEGPARLKSLFPDGIEAEFARFHFEGAQAFAPANLAALTSLVAPSQILFGTDYASFPMSHSVEAFRAATLSADVRRAIGRTNALDLFPRLRA